MAYGGQYSFWQVNSYSDSNAKLAFTFNGQTSGLGMADFLLGRASQLSAGTFSEQFKSGRYFGLYGSGYLEGESEMDPELRHAVGALFPAHQPRRQCHQF